MTLTFTKVANWITQTHRRSTNTHWLSGNAFFLPSSLRLNTNLQVPNTKDRSCVSGEPTTFFSNAFLHIRNIEQRPLPQTDTHPVLEKNDTAECETKTKRKKHRVADKDAITQNQNFKHKSISKKSKALEISMGVTDDQSVGYKLNGSQKNWLSIGENIGACLVKIKTKLPKH